MCGIAGWVSPRPEAEAKAYVAEMCNALAHRGPDGEGVSYRSGVALGHRRLAIIGLGSGRQPVEDRRTGVSLTYNGEIYNYVELADALGIESSGISDTDVLLAAYLRWGLDMLPRLQGMFAFAIHDPRSQMLHLVRDRIGIKPLFYCHQGKQLAFASEISALLKCPLVPEEIAPQALASYLQIGYVPSPGTVYRHIRKVPPAACLSLNLDTGSLHSHTYWALSYGVRAVSRDQATGELEELLDKVVSQHVRADVPFGAFLSGGVDSTLVVERMSRLLPAPVQTFTMAFDEEQSPDEPFAAEAAQVLGTQHTLERVSAQVDESFVRRLMASFGEPFADSSMVPTFFVSGVAAKRVKMVLSGDGGDELFGGYDSYPLVADRAGYGWKRHVFRLAGALGWGGRARHWRWRGASWQQLHMLQRQYLTADDLRALMPGAKPDASLLEEVLPSGRDPVWACQQHDLANYLLDDILVKVDRMSMAHALEVRVPLLDHRLVEFAFSLSPDLRLRPENSGWQTKPLLKDLLAKRFSPAFIHRRKAGFGVPFESAMKTTLRPMLDEMREGGVGALADHVEPKAVARIIGAFQSGVPGHSAQAWALLTLQCWAESRGK
jgi:asparagine synthase (glutamine-hydrolysing)